MDQTLLSRYRLLEEIGKGGMAVVYRGEDTTLKREVAVKVLHSFLADKKESRRRFQREARVVAKLRHENILEIFDYSGLDSDESFIVTEFIHGETLSSFLEEHTIEVPEVAALVVSEIVRAVHHAHESAIIHRDIKPENIMIREDGVLKLMDFGIAQIVDTQKLTLTGQLLGSPAYMAPEMVLGGGVDFRTDIFSLGVMLYRLATGELPFVGKNPHEILKKIAEAEHLPPSMVNPAVSQALEDIIERSLALEKDNRYSSAMDMLNDLEELLRSVDIEEPTEDAKEFFQNPGEYGEALRVKLVEGLLEDAREHSRVGRFPAALRDLNRVLSLDEGNPRVPDLLKGIRRRQNVRYFLRNAGLVVVAILVLTGVGFGIWHISKQEKEGKTGRFGGLATRNRGGPGAGEGVDGGLGYSGGGDPSGDAGSAGNGAAQWSLPRDGSDGGGRRSNVRDATRGGGNARGGARNRGSGSPGNRGARARGRGSSARQRGGDPRGGRSGEKITKPRKFTLLPFPAAVKVSLNGKRLGDYGPNLKTLTLEPGEHRLNISSPFCYPKTIHIKASDTGQVLRPRLRWRPAKIRVVSNVPADVLVGSSWTKTNSPIPLRVQVPRSSMDGSVKVLVKVSATNYHTWQKRLELKAGTTRKVRVKLKKL